MIPTIPQIQNQPVTVHITSGDQHLDELVTEAQNMLEQIHSDDYDTSPLRAALDDIDEYISRRVQ